MRSFLLALAVTAALFGPAAAAPQRSSVHEGVRAYRVAHERQILDELIQLLSMPNVATDQQAIERNADHLVSAFRRRGFSTRLLAAGPATPPAVYAELATPGARRTLVIYAHYDGQPATQASWRSPPWEPVVRTGIETNQEREVDWRNEPVDGMWRVYARSASDDKAPIQVLLSAIDALQANGAPLAVNLKVFVEGEEEQGSPHLPAILDAHRDLLAGDLLVMADGPRDASGRVQLFLGARGVATLDLTVFGPVRPLHSGHYGNWAPNPAISLTHLLASLRDEDGMILIPGFYDDVRPLSQTDLAALEALPAAEDGLRRELLIARPETRERLALATARPALNLTGIRVNDVGAGATNVISPEASAAIDFRLVPGQTPAGVRERVEAFIRSKGWQIVDEVPDAATRGSHPRVVRMSWVEGYPGYRVGLDTPAANAVRAAVQRATTQPPVIHPMVGGSVPMAIFAEALDIPVVGLSIVNHDNNQHGADENVRLGELWEGIEVYAQLLVSRW